jgi:hypothetical protein
MAISEQEFQEWTTKLRSSFGIPSKVFKSQEIYSIVVKKIQECSDKGRTIPASTAETFLTWKKLAEAKGLVLSDPPGKAVAAPVDAVLVTPQHSRYKPVPVERVEPAQGEERTALFDRLDEISKTLTKKNQERRSTFTRWVIEEADSLEEAHRIHQRLGTESDFWLWAEENTGYDKNTVRQWFQVRLAFLDWDKDLPLPQISGGMINWLAQLPEPYAKPILRGEMLTSEGKKFNEIPISSVKPGVMTLRRWVEALKEKFTQESNANKPVKPVKARNTPLLTPSNWTEDLNEDEEVELDSPGTDQDESNSELDSTLAQTRSERRHQTTPRVGPLDKLKAAGLHLRQTWDDTKKALVDSQTSGVLSTETVNDLQVLNSLSKEITLVLSNILK